MGLSENVLTLYTAEIERRGGEAVVTVPERELDLGELADGDTCRVALYPARNGGGGNASTDSTTTRNTRTRNGPPVAVGDTIDVEIEDVGDQGDGIARIGPGYVVFVPDTHIGDSVTIEITEARENFAFADVVSETAGR